MADYFSNFTGKEVDTAVYRLLNFAKADFTSTTFSNISTDEAIIKDYDTITISGNVYSVLWQIAPTSSNQVYGIGVHQTTGRLYQIYNNKGTYSATALDSNTDTKNTAGTTNSTSKLFLAGATSQAANPVTYSNSAVYTTNGTLYATAFNENGTALASKYLGISAKAASATVADSANAVTWTNVSGKPSSYTPAAHASSATTYGIGTSANYGHVKLGAAEQNGATASDGVVAPNGHTHSQYAKSADLSTVATSGAYSDLSGTPDLSKYVSYTANASVSVAGSTKTTNTLSPSTLFVSNGLIMGGTAQQAGLVTRGICGVTTPTSTTGSCNKDNLYINYDGDNNYSRKMVLGAGSIGSAISNSNNAYTYCAVRGDQMVSYVTSFSGISKTGTVTSLTFNTNNSTAQTATSETITTSGTINLHKVAKTGSYSDLSGTPSLADVATSGAYSDLSGTPTLATVATSGSYNDLSNKPTITDTKNTAGSTSSTSKLFLIGATSQAANPQTYSNASVYATNGALYATTFYENNAILASKYLGLHSTADSAVTATTATTATYAGSSNYSRFIMTDPNDISSGGPVWGIGAILNPDNDRLLVGTLPDLTEKTPATYEITDTDIGSGDVEFRSTIAQFSTNGLGGVHISDLTQSQSQLVVQSFLSNNASKYYAAVVGSASYAGFAVGTGKALDPYTAAPYSGSTVTLYGLDSIAHKGKTLNLPSTAGTIPTITYDDGVMTVNV